MRADFYLLLGQKSSADVIIALIQKALNKQWRVGLHVDKNHLDELSMALWQTIPNSFLAHEVISASRCQTCIAPIMLFYSPPDDIDTLDYYINFSQTSVPYQNEQGRYADIIANDEAFIQAGRQRYAEQKQTNNELHFHEIA